MSTITKQQQEAIVQFLATHELPVGLGSKEAACSIAAINLSLTGELTDTIPGCMSEVIGKWVIVIQDSMPNVIRNSNEWKRLLPLAAGTGRYHENERFKIIMQWLWETVLPSSQTIANEHGFGDEWQKMCQEKTSIAARTAARTADAAFDAARATRTAADAAIAADTADAAFAARAAAFAAEGRDAAAAAACAAEGRDAAAAAARATRAAVAAAGDAARAAARAAVAFAAVAFATRAAIANEKIWQIFNPCELLQKLIEL